MEGADDSVQLFVGCRGARVGRPRVLGWQGVLLSKVGDGRGPMAGTTDMGAAGPWRGPDRGIPRAESNDPMDI